jgi:TPR repeat protein/Fe2+ or Zn2+ uptake regulation protein
MTTPRSIVSTPQYLKHGGLKMSPSKIAHIYNPGNQTQEELIANFVVRHKEFNEIFNDIKTSPMQAPEQQNIIQGPRGTGKTTLLLRLYYEVENDPALKPWLLPVIFGEEQYHINSLCKLWESVAEILEEKEEFSGLYDGFEKAQGADDYETVCFGLLSKALQDKNRKLILFLDNFGDLLDRFTEAEHHRLREILLTSSDLRIIGASSVTLETTYDYSKPFFDFFRFIYIGGLDSKETRELLLNLGQNYGQGKIKDIVESHPERVEIMRRLTGGIPRTIILLFEVFVDDKSGNSLSDLEIVLDRVTPLYKHRMEDLSRQQQVIIDVMALNWDAMSVKEISESIRMESKAISAQLKQLEKNRVVHKIETKTKNYLYQITERFFNIWYLMRQGRRREKNKVLWLVKFMQEWCSREELVERTHKHIEALSNADYHAGHAYFMTEALAKLVSGELQQELINKTREFLSLKDKALLKNLSKSDKELVDGLIGFLEKEDYKRCIRLLEENEDRTTPLILAVFGVVYQFLQDKKKAEGYYLKAIDKGHVEALLNLANLYSDQQKYDQAEGYYLKAINKGHVEALNNLANLYSDQQKYDQAEGYYLKAIDKGHVEALNNLANLYSDQQKYDQAEGYYLKAIDKGHVGALFNLAILYSEQQKYDQAEAYYLKAINKGHVEALNNLANLYSDQQKYDQAEGYYLKAIDKGHVGALFNLANLYRKQEKYEKAEGYYLKAIDKGHVDALLNLANLNNDQQKYDQAEAYYLKAIDKGHVGALFNLAILYKKQEKYEKAEEYYLKAIDKGHVDALLNLANLNNDQQKYDQAEAYYLKAIDKGDVKALFNLANLYSDQQKYDQAEAYYLKAIDKGDVKAIANMSIMYYEQKRDKKKALELMEKADKEMKDLRTKYWLIKILLWNNKTKTAFRHFEEIMKDRSILENNISLISSCLTSFMARKQYHFVLRFFEEKGSDLKDRLRPVYYALMHFLKDEYPNEIKKMGEEIRETVEEIIREVDRLRVDYA